MVLCRSDPFLSQSRVNKVRWDNRWFLVNVLGVNSTRAGLEKRFVAAGVAYQMLLKG